mgnify:FL=1
MKKAIKSLLIVVVLALTLIAGVFAKTTYFDPQLNQTVTRGGDSGIGFIGCHKEFPMQLRNAVLYESYLFDDNRKIVRNVLHINTQPFPTITIGNKVVQLDSNYSSLGNGFSVKLLENYIGGARVLVKSDC